MAKHDYLMQELERFSKALAKVIFGKSSPQEEQKFYGDLQALSNEYIGLDSNMLFYLPKEQLLMLFSLQGKLDAMKCTMAGLTLMHYAQAHTDAAKAALLGAKGKTLLTAAYHSYGGYLNPEHQHYLEDASY